MRDIITASHGARLVFNSKKAVFFFLCLFLFFNSYLLLYDKPRISVHPMGVSENVICRYSSGVHDLVALISIISAFWARLFLFISHETVSKFFPWCICPFPEGWKIAYHIRATSFIVKVDVFGLFCPLLLNDAGEKNLMIQIPKSHKLQELNLTI